MFDFEIFSTDGKARHGKFSTPHGDFETPVFMPCGTKGAVKSFLPRDMKDLGCEIYLNNTYHMYLRPGHKLVEKMGGLHKFQSWDGPILTDSGGYQAFSLSKLNKISWNGVEFRSIIDGSKHMFTPKYCMEVQKGLGADIVMAFDDCPPGDCNKVRSILSLDRTFKWFEECHEYWRESGMYKSQALFPIVQGATFEDLRRKCCQFLTKFDTPGYAVGGVAVGDAREDRLKVYDWCNEELPENKPRYVMGVGDPVDLLEGIARGMDMFDCVLPTRLARTGSVYLWEGRKSIRNASFRGSEEPLCEGCDCHTCTNFSRGYLHHLLMEKEMTGLKLLSIHNIHFLYSLMRKSRDLIDKGEFYPWYEEFIKKYKAM